jgi:HSF-type DNA-binding
MPFPVKLYEMLIRVEDEGLNRIVSWQPHGRCFVVHDPVQFKALLPNFFKLSKIASFQRQLNLYGFQRLTVGVDKGGYYNELFLRNRPDLVLKIQRVKVKGTGVRAKSNPKEEPNLYTYPAVDDLAATVVTKNPSDSLDREFPDVQFSATPTMLSADIVPRELHTLDKVEATKHDGLPDMISPMHIRRDPSSQSVNCASRSEDYFKRALRDVSAQITADELMRRPNAAGSKIQEDVWDCDVVKSEVSFDRLIDEMFSHNQSLDFSDLLKLAAV